MSGGETAEMPGMYKDNDYDVAGFAVGVIPSNASLHDVHDGDLVLGVTSSGLRYCDLSLLDIANGQNIFDLNQGNKSYRD